MLSRLTYQITSSYSDDNIYREKVSRMSIMITSFTIIEIGKVICFVNNQQNILSMSLKSQFNMFIKLFKYETKFNIIKASFLTFPCQIASHRVSRFAYHPFREGSLAINLPRISSTAPRSHQNQALLVLMCLLLFQLQKYTCRNYTKRHI